MQCVIISVMIVLQAGCSVEKMLWSDLELGLDLAQSKCICSARQKRSREINRLLKGDIMSVDTYCMVQSAPVHAPT